VRDFLTGVGYFGQGLGMLVRRPKLLLIGMLPAVLTTAILLGAMIALVANIGHLAALVTPFADGWAGGWRVTARVVVGITMAGGSVLLGLVSFTALTSVVGSPFYQHIAERIEDDLGVAEGRGRGPAWKPPLAEIRDAIVLTLRSLLFTIPLFLAGFLPAVGQTVVPVLVVLVTAWFMTLQVASVSFYRRGVYLRRQTAMLRQRRMLALGFGVPAVVLCMIPLMAIVVMPVTFAGGVLVALDVLA
jgi:CysZ protein